MKKYRLDFSNSNNVWYFVKDFYGTEKEMLEYANEELNSKRYNYYNLWIHDDNGDLLYKEYTLGGKFRRGNKKLEKLISKL